MARLSEHLRHPDEDSDDKALARAIRAAQADGELTIDRRLQLRQPAVVHQPIAIRGVGLNFDGVHTRPRALIEAVGDDWGPGDALLRVKTAHARLDGFTCDANGRAGYALVLDTCHNASISNVVAMGAQTINLLSYRSMNSAFWSVTAVDGARDGCVVFSGNGQRFFGCNFNRNKGRQLVLRGFGFKHPANWIPKSDDRRGSPCSGLFVSGCGFDCSGMQRDEERGCAASIEGCEGVEVSASRIEGTFAGYVVIGSRHVKLSALRGNERGPNVYVQGGSYDVDVDYFISTTPGGRAMVWVGLDRKAEQLDIDDDFLLEGEEDVIGTSRVTRPKSADVFEYRSFVLSPEWAMFQRRNFNLYG